MSKVNSFWHSVLFFIIQLLIHLKSSLISTGLLFVVLRYLVLHNFMLFFDSEDGWIFRNKVRATLPSCLESQRKSQGVFSFEVCSRNHACWCCFCTCRRTVVKWWRLASWRAAEAAQMTAPVPGSSAFLPCRRNTTKTCRTCGPSGRGCGSKPRDVTRLSSNWRNIILYAPIILCPVFARLCCTCCTF